MKNIVFVGECMVELSGSDQNCRIGFGGDTLNSAVYAARLSGANAKVSYITRLGQDHYSQNMRAAWQAEGIDTKQVSMIEGRTAGLYAISTDETGERSFTYWRNNSPARELFQGQVTEAELAVLGKADAIYTSGITLGILSSTGRSNLLYAMHAAKSRGALVAFDPNYRPSLWKDTETAGLAIEDAFAASSLVFSSDSEQKALFGDKTRAKAAQRLQDAGVTEWVLREGDADFTIGDAGEQIELPVSSVTKVVDTTGAGDAFNGAYLAQRVAGGVPRSAGELAAKVSACVIQHPGAIVDARLLAEISA